MRPTRFLRAGILGILGAAACASPAPSTSPGNPPPAARTPSWKAEGPFPQVRYYAIAET